MMQNRKKLGVVVALIVIVLSAIVLQDYIIKHAPVSISCILSIEIVQGNGSVSGTPSGVYPQNTTITLRANPDPGFLLQMWQVNNVNMGNQSSFSFTISRNTLVQIFFGTVSIPILPTDVLTTGFAGVRVTESFTSLNNSVDIPQMNLFLSTGNHYYWVQTELAYGNRLGLSANGLPDTGFWLGDCIWDAGSDYIATGPQQQNGYFYDGISPYANLVFFTFIGTDLHLHTELYVNAVLMANIDWSIQQSIFPTPLSSGSEFIPSGVGGVNGSAAYFGNEIIFTGYLTSQPNNVSAPIVPSLMTASGTMLIQTFVDGNYHAPRLGYVYRSGNGPYWIAPPTNVAWYDDDSAEWTQSIVFQINGNTVSFSSLLTLSSWCTGVTLLGD